MSPEDRKKILDLAEEWTKEIKRLQAKKRQLSVQLIPISDEKYVSHWNEIHYEDGYGDGLDFAVHDLLTLLVKSF